jgi:metal-responsive CopG/Arc/MetJ family transcriptional regulator
MTKRFTGIRIDEELLVGLETLRERDGVPVAESIRRAIRAYLEERGVIAKAERKRAVTRKRS